MTSARRDPPPLDTDPVVRLRRVDIGYDEHPVVRGADFTMRRGEVVGVLGANGSGKSTLVRGILGLASVLAGEVELFGVPAGRFRERWRIGYVPQRHTVGGTVPTTVEEVVASGRLPRKRLLSPMTGADRRAVAAAVGAVRLAERAREDVGTLSGGQARRALIARALAAEPEVLVMDEPMAGVDAVNQEILAAVLARLVADGLTVLLVAHELGPVSPLVSRAVVMRGGRVAYDGPLHQVPAQTVPGDGHLHGEPPPSRGLGLTG
jgi:zinc transport system ATP-binding protein